MTLINLLTISGSLRAHSSNSALLLGLLHSLLRIIASPLIMDSVIFRILILIWMVMITFRLQR